MNTSSPFGAHLTEIFMSQDPQLSDSPSATTPQYKSLPQVCQTSNNNNSSSDPSGKEKGTYSVEDIH